MPRGHYVRQPSTITSLRNELLAIGAESRYRQLLDDQRALLKAFPALRKLQVNGSDALDLLLDRKPAGPAPEALQLFRQRKVKKAKRVKRQPGKQPGGASLVDQAVQVLRERRLPMMPRAIASALWDRGWRPKTANTDAKRTATVAVMLRTAIAKKRNPELLVETTTKPYSYRVN
jgi:hypothetical protein